MPDLSFENDAYRQGYTNVAGIDEAGRGCLAGPVVAAAVIFNAGYFIEDVDDSKKLSPVRRERLFDIISANAMGIGVGIVDNQDIDKINIYNATIKAMKLAVEEIAIHPDYLLIDAVPLKDLSIPQLSIIKGDTLSFTIAAASIIAKVTRDRLMAEYHLSFPEYNFITHKGYGTPEHIEQLRKFGPCKIHRESFIGKIPGCQD
ncbi:MAG: ribonuclease HII [Nitrospirae bacterium]|nr:ribonuclease HII [Nitrospirota bacterium]